MSLEQAIHKMTAFSYVIVGGTPVIERSARTHAFPGKVLKRRSPGITAGNGSA
ncbi:MAG: hypothetical protein OEN23_21130 [Paracoccaceae bacterium]|nr:hypothetical protein [Paracoccaceae bacterium]